MKGLFSLLYKGSSCDVDCIVRVDKNEEDDGVGGLSIIGERVSVGQINADFSITVTPERLSNNIKTGLAEIYEDIFRVSQLYGFESVYIPQLITGNSRFDSAYNWQDVYVAYSSYILENTDVYTKYIVGVNSQEEADLGNALLATLEGNNNKDEAIEADDELIEDEDEAENELNSGKNQLWVFKEALLNPKDDENYKMDLVVGFYEDIYHNRHCYTLVREKASSKDDSIYGYIFEDIELYKEDGLQFLPIYSDSEAAERANKKEGYVVRNFDSFWVCSAVKYRNHLSSDVINGFIIDGNVKISNADIYRLYNQFDIGVRTTHARGERITQEARLEFLKDRKRASLDILDEALECGNADAYLSYGHVLSSIEEGKKRPFNNSYRNNEILHNLKYGLILGSYAGPLTYYNALKSIKKKVLNRDEILMSYLSTLHEAKKRGEGLWFCIYASRIIDEFGDLLSKRAKEAIVLDAIKVSKEISMWNPIAAAISSFDFVDFESLLEKIREEKE